MPHLKTSVGFTVLRNSTAYGRLYPRFYTALQSNFPFHFTSESCRRLCLYRNLHKLQPCPSMHIKIIWRTQQRPSNSFSHLVKHPQQPQTMITYAVFSNLLFTQCTRCKYWAENRPCLQTSKTIRRMCRPSRVSLYPMLE